MTMGTIYIDRRTPRIRRHILWLIVLSIPFFLLAQHVGGAYVWTAHVSHAWQHMWSQARAGWRKRAQLYKAFRQ